MERPGVLFSLAVILCFIFFIRMVLKEHGQNAAYSFCRDRRDADLSLFLGQLSSMTAMRLPLLECLEHIIEEYRRTPRKNRAFIASLAAVARDLKAGHSLSQSMARRRSSIFPSPLIRLVAVAESGDELAPMLTMAADMYRQRSIYATRLLQAVIYPVILAILCIPNMLLLVCYMYPIFNPMFNEMNMTLPLSYTLLILFLDALVDDATWVFGGIVIIALSIAFASKRPALMDDLVMKLPFIGKALLSHDLSCFLATVGRLLSRSVPLSEALHAGAEMVQLRSVRHSIDCMASKKGMALSMLMKSERCFSPSLIWMVSMAEKAEVLDSALIKISEFYGREAGNMMDRAVGWLKPALITAFGLIVAMFAVGTYMPFMALLNEISSFYLPL